jgi:hypothetical protein
MVTRDKQIDAVVDGVAEPGRVVLVTGDEGTGKSHLLHQVVDLLEGQGRVVRPIHGAGSTETVAMGAFSGIVGTLAPVPPVLGGLGAVGADRPGEAPGPAPALLAASLVAHLRSLGSPDAPACLVVDDADRLDAASVQVMLHAIARASADTAPDAPSSAITVVAAARPDRPWSDGFRALAGSAGTRVRLVPLSRSALAVLAAELLGGPLTSAAHAELWRSPRACPSCGRAARLVEGGGLLVPTDCRTARTGEAGADPTWSPGSARRRCDRRSTTSSRTGWRSSGPTNGTCSNCSPSAGARSRSWWGGGRRTRGERGRTCWTASSSDAWW